MASDALVARLIGGVPLAAGVLVALLGGLCTGWIVVPATIEFWGSHGFSTLGDLWTVLAGGALTVTVGVLLARAGLRRIRDVGGAGSGAGERQ